MASQFEIENYLRSVGINPTDFNAPFFKREQKLHNVTHRHTIHDTRGEVFSAKFSPDQSYLAASYADGSLSIYGGYHGEKIFKIEDEQMKFPITALCWKPTSVLQMENQSFKALSADGRIMQWRPKYQSEMKSLIVSETNSF